MDNREKVKYFYEHITSNHLIDKVDKYVSKDCTIRIGETVIPVGIAGMKQHMVEVRKTYPDLKMTITRQYCDGEYVISEFIMEGSFKGEWLGIKPTGEKLSITGVNIDKVVDGEIVEHGGAANTFEPLFDAKLIQPTPK